MNFGCNQRTEEPDQTPAGGMGGSKDARDCQEPGPNPGLDLAVKAREDLPALFNQLEFTGHGAEVGVQAGNFSALLRQGWKSGTIHLIDRWRFEPSYDDVANVDDGEQEKLYRSVITRFAGQTNVVVHRLDSLQAANQFADGFFDWVYLDADHSFYGILADLSAWYPKVRLGGILAGHDYFDGQFPFGSFGVRSAVQQFIRDKNVELFVTSEPVIIRSWYFRKPISAAISQHSSAPTTIDLQSVSDALARGDLWGARDDLTKLILEQPKHEGAIAALGSVEFQLHNYGASLLLFQRAVALNPKDPGLLVQLAAAAWRVNQWALFASSLKRAFALEPHNLPALTLMANAYLQQENFTQAAPLFKLILTLSPGNLNALLSLGKCLLGTGDVKGALSAYQEALSSAPNNKTAISGLQTAQSRLPAS